jgi:hypothetical protein
VGAYERDEPRKGVQEPEHVEPLEGTLKCPRSFEKDDFFAYFVKAAEAVRQWLLDHNETSTET